MLNTCAERFVNLLNENGLKFESGLDKDGDSVVTLPYNGKTAKMFFTGDEGGYFSFYLVMERVPQDKTIEAIIECNNFNTQYKWVTAYVDKDNDLILHTDAILTEQTAADVAFELMVRALKIMDTAKPEFMREIYA